MPFSFSLEEEKPQPAISGYTFMAYPTYHEKQILCHCVLDGLHDPGLGTIPQPTQ